MENEKNIDAFEKDCETILLENSDLDTLFSLTDNLLNYSLEKEFNVEYITRQLEIIGGKVFSNVVTFCLDLTVDDCRAVLNSSKIDINLRQKIMFLVAKYSMIYSQIKEKNNNELGWSYAKYNIIDIGDNYFLELKLHLNDGSIHVTRNTSDSLAFLASFMLDSLLAINKISPANRTIIAQIKEKVKLFDEKDT